MKRTVTSLAKRPNRLEPSDEVIREVQREQSDIVRRLLRIQFETLREPSLPRTRAGQPSIYPFLSPGVAGRSEPLATRRPRTGD